MKPRTKKKVVCNCYLCGADLFQGEPRTLLSKENKITKILWKCVICKKMII